jgi:hypothetical protein
MTRKERVNAAPRLTDAQWREVVEMVARVADRLEDMTTRLDVVERRLAGPPLRTADRTAGPRSVQGGEAT